VTITDELTQTERGVLASFRRSRAAGYDIRWKYRSERGPYESLADKGILTRHETRHH
jgi:hypothetical protein